MAGVISRPGGSLTPMAEWLLPAGRDLRERPGASRTQLEGTSLYAEYYARMLAWTCRQASYVVTPTETVARQLAQAVRLGGRPVPIPLGIDHWAEGATGDPDILDTFPGQYLLYVGQARMHKGLPELIEAYQYSQASSRNVPLVCAGRDFAPGTDAAAQLEGALGGNAIAIGEVPDDTLRHLYAHATALVHLAVHEGFGLTPLEAMTCGSRVIVSGIPVLRETLGQHAEFVESDNALDAAGAIDKILAERKCREREGLGEAYDDSDIYPDVRAALSKLRDMGLWVGIAGNQTAKAGQILRSMDLPANLVATSDDWGVAKPGQAFFRRVIEVAPSVTLSQTAAPAIGRPPLPGRPGPGETTGPPGGHTGMHARLSGARQAGTRRQRGPSVAVRGKPTVTLTVLASRTPFRYLSVDPAIQRSTTLQGETPRDREKTARIAENSQLAGRFRRWWQVLGSNQRRLSRRFYRPLPYTAWPADMWPAAELRPAFAWVLVESAVADPGLNGDEGFGTVLVVRREGRGAGNGGSGVSGKIAGASKCLEVRRPLKGNGDGAPGLSLCSWRSSLAWRWACDLRWVQKAAPLTVITSTAAGGSESSRPGPPG